MIKNHSMKNIQTHAFLFLLLISVMILGLSSCQEDVDNPQPPVKGLIIGAILPLDQEKGLERENALRLSMDEINSAGGVGNGYFLNLIVMSSEGADRKVAATTAAKLITSHNNNTVGFISSFSSSTTGIIEELSIPDHYPCISGSATANSLTGISKYFHRLCPPDNFEANILSDKAITYGLNSVAIAVENGDTYSEDLSAAFQNTFTGNISAVINFDKEDLDYADKINQLISGNPDAIFVSMLNPASYIKFFDHLPVLNNTSFILPDAFYSTDFFQADIEQIIGEVNGHPKNFGALPSADTTTDEYIFFKDALWQTYNQEVGSYNAQFYDVGYILAMAIEKALMEVSTADMIEFREKVNDYIRIVSHGTAGDPEVTPDLGWKEIQASCQAGGVNYTGASGNCDIDPMGNTETAYSIFKVIKQGNDYKFEIIELIP